MTELCRQGIARNLYSSCCFQTKIKRYVWEEKEGEKKRNTPSSSSKVAHGNHRRDFIDQSAVIVESRDSLVTQEHFASLENDQPSPKQVKMLPPLQVIRYERDGL